MKIFIKFIGMMQKAFSRQWDWFGGSGIKLLRNLLIVIKEDERNCKNNLSAKLGDYPKN